MCRGNSSARCSRPRPETRTGVGSDEERKTKAAREEPLAAGFFSWRLLFGLPQGLHVPGKLLHTTDSLGQVLNLREDLLQPGLGGGWRVLDGRLRCRADC